MGLIVSIFLLIFLCICPPYFELWDFFVTDLSTTLQAGIVIVGIQVDEDLLHSGIES